MEFFLKIWEHWKSLSLFPESCIYFAILNSTPNKFRPHTRTVESVCRWKYLSLFHSNNNKLDIYLVLINIRKLLKESGIGGTVSIHKYRGALLKVSILVSSLASYRTSVFSKWGFWIWILWEFVSIVLCKSFSMDGYFSVVLWQPFVHLF